MTPFKFKFAFLSAGAAAAALGFLANKAMLHSGVESLYLRHGAAIAFTFLLIGLLCKGLVWALDWKAAGAAASARRRNGLKLEDAVDGLDAAGDALGAAGDVVGAAFSLEEGAIVLILPALAIALLILLGFGIFGFGAFMVADAPLLFAEVLLEGAVAGAVAAGAASGSAPASGWLFAYAKRVAPRALIVMALFFCADFAAAKIQPGAATWGEAFATFQSRREAAIEAKSQAKTQTQAQTPPADDSSADR